MFDPTRPPMTGPMTNYGNYRGPRGRDYPPRPIRGRTPPGYVEYNLILCMKLSNF